MLERFVTKRGYESAQSRAASQFLDIHCSQRAREAVLVVPASAVIRLGYRDASRDRNPMSGEKPFVILGPDDPDTYRIGTIAHLRVRDIAVIASYRVANQVKLDRDILL